MKLKNWLVILLAGAGTAALPHPLHLSFTHLEYKSLGSRWELTVKIFSDDLQSAFDLNQAGALDLSTEPGTDAGILQLKEWLGRQLILKVDGQPITPDKWVLKGWKSREGATWMTFIFKGGRPVSELRFHNALLLDLYADQKNLFIFTLPPGQSSFEFDYNNREYVINLLK